MLLVKGGDSGQPSGDLENLSWGNIEPGPSTRVMLEEREQLGAAATLRSLKHREMEGVTSSTAVRKRQAEELQSTNERNNAAIRGPCCENFIVGLSIGIVNSSKRLAPQHSSCQCTAHEVNSTPRYISQNSAWNDSSGTEAILQRPCDSRYGVPVLQDSITVVYNRVPKCGSRTLLEVVKLLAEKNGIHGPVSMEPPGNKPRLLLLTQTVERVKSKTKAFIEGHVHYHGFDKKRVYFINIIRDPLDLLVSSFYFTRLGDGMLSDKAMANMIKRVKPEVMNETFDECVRQNRLSCTGPRALSRIMGFFCGHHPDCWKPTKWTLDEAKRNLDQYTLVGLVEEYNLTMRALEFLFPSMFSGMVETYTKLNNQTDFRSKVQTNHHVPPSPWTVTTMRERMQLEYEFYHYARARFYALLKELHIVEHKVFVTPAEEEASLLNQTGSE
ncbi:uronyl 2-sulfotransferase-like [Diadema antillarum]|uniref:uronyl 2-sulfotransferase-like n=1 Tax=Diadema antillarum TaxID=105358 RepID=UPI003A83A44A